MTSTPLLHVEVDGMRVAYREAGTGPAVLLVHGWPTSSVLWLDVMPHLAAANRVVAIDLPGYGGSAKPLDRRYDAGFYERVLDGFLDALGIDRVALVVHDVGGPVGVHWALRNPDRLTALGILNTLLYPEFSEAVVEFVRGLTTPGEREKMVSPEGITAILRLGVREPDRLAPDVLAAFVAPFAGADPAAVAAGGAAAGDVAAGDAADVAAGDAAAADAREALARAAIGLSLRQFREIGAGLPTITAPVRVIYGRQDSVLPDIARTVERLAGDLPQAEVTVLDDCAHFIQLEAPDRVGPMLAEFLAKARQ